MYVFQSLVHRHINPTTSLLDRLPIPIGTFISQNVYEHQLKSVHAITTKSSCRFVDVHNGKEEQINHSWVVRIHIVYDLIPLFLIIIATEPQGDSGCYGPRP